MAVLLDGVLQQVDTPRALYDKPANAFVAGFMGSPAMNIKTVPLTEEGGKFEGMVLPLTREQVAAAREGGDGKVTVGFRPEDTDLVSNGAGGGLSKEAAGMPIVVDLVEELGSDAYVYGTVALEGQDERFVIRTDPRSAPALGSTVYVRPRTDSHHAFHSVTGVRL